MAAAESQIEALSEQELEGLGLPEAVPSSIEAEVAAEMENEAEMEGALESTIEAVVEGLEGPEEAESETEAGRGRPRRPGRRARPGRIALGFNARVIHRYLRVALRKVTRSAPLRNRLRQATRQGPRAVTQFLLPLIQRLMPLPFRPLARIFLPQLVRVLFGQISRAAGASRAEAEMEGLELELEEI